MGTKNNPGSFDCYGNADPDEPMFILLARDVTAPGLVNEWADARLRMILAGQKPQSDLPMVKEARDCAEAMRKWRRENR